MDDVTSVVPLLLADYHSHDFDIDAYIEEIKAAGKCTLPTETTEYSDSDTAHWNSFYGRHKKGTFFKPRRYLSVEFFAYLSNLSPYSTVLEVGCGYGCSMFPLLERFKFNYIATDYSEISLEVLRSHITFDSIQHRCLVKQWDVTQPFPRFGDDVLHHWSHSGVVGGISCVLCVFALSAIHPALHVDCLKHMKSLLVQSNDSTYSPCNDNDHKSDSTNQGDVGTGRRFILFRDYGLHDMTMYRHKVRYSDCFFRRTDGTLTYYFDLSYMRHLAETVGLTVVELQYATVRVENRKQSSIMHRVFVHAVLSL